MANIVTVLGNLVVNGLTTLVGLLSRTNGTASVGFDLQIGFQADLHYEADVIGTPNRTPNFYT